MRAPARPRRCLAQGNGGGGGGDEGVDGSGPAAHDGGASGRAVVAGATPRVPPEAFAEPPLPEAGLLAPVRRKTSRRKKAELVQCAERMHHDPRAYSVAMPVLEGEPGELEPGLGAAGWREAEVLAGTLVEPSVEPGAEVEAVLDPVEVEPVGEHGVAAAERALAAPPCLGSLDASFMSDASALTEAGDADLAALMAEAALLGGDEAGMGDEGTLDDIESVLCGADVSPSLAAKAVGGDASGVPPSAAGDTNGSSTVAPTDRLQRQNNVVVNRPKSVEESSGVATVTKAALALAPAPLAAPPMPEAQPAMVAVTDIEEEEPVAPVPPPASEPLEARPSSPVREPCLWPEAVPQAAAPTVHLAAPAAFIDFARVFGIDPAAGREARRQQSSSDAPAATTDAAEPDAALVAESASGVTVTPARNAEADIADIAAAADGGVLEDLGSVLLDTPGNGGEGDGLVDDAADRHGGWGNASAGPSAPLRRPSAVEELAALDDGAWVRSVRAVSVPTAVTADHTVYTIEVATAAGAPLVAHRRFREFVALRRSLLAAGLARPLGAAWDVAAQPWLGALGRRSAAVIDARRRRLQDALRWAHAAARAQGNDATVIAGALRRFIDPDAAGNGSSSAGRAWCKAPKLGLATFEYDVCV